MLTKKIKKNFEENKKVYILAGALVVTGVLIGIKYQRGVDARSLQKKLEGVTMFKKAIEPMFPDTMPISEIKEVLKAIEGAEFMDALVTNVHGKQSIIVRTAEVL